MSGFTRLLSWVLTVLVATLLIYWLWNAVLVRALTIAQPIGFWDALGVAVLARLLFGPNLIDEKLIIEYVPKQVSRAVGGVVRKRSK